MYVTQASKIWGIPADVGTRPLDKDWKGTSKHLGPHHYTPLRKSLELKTSAALLSIVAGSVAWASARLQAFPEGARLAQLAEAIFCFQVDPRYFIVAAEFGFFPQTDGMPLPEAVIEVYPWALCQDLFSFDDMWPVYPPTIETAQIIHLTRHIMPAGDKSYDRWVEGAIFALDQNAPFLDSRKEPLPDGSPEEVYNAEACRAIGQPLGPSALLPGLPFDQARNRAEVAEILEQAGTLHNPYLRSPDEMIARRFTGTPYRMTP
ncbi:MAG: hypothetical protein JNK19_17270 [Tabrizicola sp.]|nr:hypothetical protein [Tabrizicola sp.]